MTVLRRASADTIAATTALSSAPAYPRFLPVGDAALTVEFGNVVAPEPNAQAIALDTALAAAQLGGIVETVPSYRSLLVCYDPLEISYDQLIIELGRLLSHNLRQEAERSAVWHVPVIYQPPHAHDLPEVAQRLGLTEERVISIHTSADYTVYTIGYAPGMPYLGGVPAALHLSRREGPRPRVDPGAVMIGGVQACIVPTVVPSAWYQLGQTPLRPFDPTRQDPFLFRPGDHIRFRQVCPAEFEHLSHLTSDALVALARGGA